MPSKRRKGRPRTLNPLINRNVMVPPDLDGWLKEKAKSRSCSISSYTRWVLLKERQQEADVQEPEPVAATA